MPVTIRKRFSLKQTIENINVGLVRMYVTAYRISWIIVTSDLVISYTDIYIIEAFNSTSRYLDDLLNTDNSHFEGIINLIYPHELQLNEANTSGTERPFFDLHLSISNVFFSSKIYDKRDDINLIL